MKPTQLRRRYTTADYLPRGGEALGQVRHDLGVQQHKTGDVQYLTANSITFTGSNTPPVIQPVRSAADYLTYRLGVSVALR